MSRRRTSITLAVLCGSLSSLALMAAPAMATKIHLFSKSFPLPKSASPLEVAINQSTGEVYATSFNSGVVDAFDASGTSDPTHPQFTETDGTTPYPFNGPYGLDVDNSVGPDQGDVYVADYYAGDVLQFNASGIRTAQAPITAANVPSRGMTQSGGLSAVVNNGAFNPTGVTVSANGDVYVADFSNNVVDVFQPNGTFVSQLGAGHISGPYAIALNASGDLYVAHNGSGLIEFEPSGACVNSCYSIDPVAYLGVATDPEGDVYGSERGSINEFSSSGDQIVRFGNFSVGRGIAFNDTSSAIYVADEGTGMVDVFEPATAPTITVGPTTNLTQTSAELTGRVDPDAADGGGPITACHFEYGPEEGNYSSGTLPCLSPGPADAEVGTVASPIESPTEVHADLTGLVTLKAYHYRLVASNTGAFTGYGSDQTFELSPALPAIEDTSASSLIPTAATLNAEINPGSGPTVYHFQYGTTAAYGSQTLIGESIGSDNVDHPVSSGITGLTPDTTYHYRVVAINFTGTTHGPDQTFTTPDLPSVSGSSASNVTSSTATLTAQLNPGLAVTTYHFQYGASASYGSSTPEGPSIGADNLAHTVSVDLAGLAPATTYHFRVLATNAFGATTGVDQSFTTDAAMPLANPQKKCKRGFVRRHGKCVKKPQQNKKHNATHHEWGGKQ